MALLNRKKQGFTLVEMLIAVAIFGILALLGASLFTNILRMQKKINLENAIYEDSRYMMERVVKLVRESAIDYEEYYNQLVIKKMKQAVGGDSFYGENYGYYATMFYHPGLKPGESIGGSPQYPRAYGAYYNDGIPATKICEVEKNTHKLIDCLPDTVTVETPAAGYEVVLQDTVDYNTGFNPYFDEDGLNTYSASAFCDSLKGVDCPVPWPTATIHMQKELYLIDQYGQKKYILARELLDVNGHYGLSLLTLDGKDLNLNNITDNWDSCAKGYECSSSKSLRDGDLTRTKIGVSMYEDFIPLTPLRSNVRDVRFYVSPIEDPRKAFAETDPTVGESVVQIQPHVTIVLTLEPAADQLSGYPGPAPTITLQTTVSSRIYHEVESYGP